MTLSLGIVTSMFYCDRRDASPWLTYYMVKRNYINCQYKVGVMSFENKKITNIDFLGKARIALLVTFTLLIVSASSFFTKGLNLGIDFYWWYVS